MKKNILTKIYTRTGDKGTTGFCGGSRVSKDDLRIECLGAVDELNSCLGVARSFMDDLPRGSALRRKIDPMLKKIQGELFDVCRILARSKGSLDAACIGRWEKVMDELLKKLPPRGFVLPGGGKIAAVLHLARTICRRAERRCVTLARKTPVDLLVLSYLNRLSDTLFVLARYAAEK